jgi:glycine dehydrogenase
MSTPVNEPASRSLPAIAQPDDFVRRHIGPRPDEMVAMARACGFDSVAALVEAAVPPVIRLGSPPSCRRRWAGGSAGPVQAIAGRNQVFRSFIGIGITARSPRR